MACGTLFDMNSHLKLHTKHTKHIRCTVKNTSMMFMKNICKLTSVI